MNQGWRGYSRGGIPWGLRWEGREGCWRNGGRLVGGRGGMEKPGGRLRPGGRFRPGGRLRPGGKRGWGWLGRLDGPLASYNALSEASWSR